MDKNAAEIIALNALSWVLGNDELRAIFVGSTGLDPQSLQSNAGDSELSLAVMDFLSMNDEWVLGFCQSAGLDPQSFLSVRASLQGGGLVHWT